MHRSIYMLMLAGAALTSGPIAEAQERMVLKAQVTDADGRITLGDLFDNAGSAADVVVAQRSGQTAVLDAGRVQVMARQAGVMWDNPKGLRRIIVSAGADGRPVQTTTVAVAQAGKTKDVLVFTRAMNTGEIVSPADIAFAPVQAHLATGSLVYDAQSAIGKSIKFPIREGGPVRASDLSSPVVIKRAETVQVTWSHSGVSLSMTGIAQKDGAVGDVIMVQNPQSKKLIEVLVTGPGTGVTGEAAQRMRAQALYSSN